MSRSMNAILEILRRRLGAALERTSSRISRLPSRLRDGLRRLSLPERSARLAASVLGPVRLRAGAACRWIGRTGLQAWRRVPRVESLKVRLGLSAAAVATLILAVTWITLTASARSVATLEAQKQVTDIVSRFSGIYAEAVAAKDLMQIHVFSRGLLDHGVKAISIVESSGNVLYASDAELEAEALFAARDLKALDDVVLGTVDEEGNSLIHAATPIRFGSKGVGMLHLWLDRTGLEKRILDAQTFIYPIFVSGFLLMVLLGSVALHTPFRVLKRLTQAAKLIGAGDLSSRVPVQGRDEVAEFCRSFNAMVESLQKARQVILRSHLEIIEAMITVVEAKDTYTQGHCLRVQAYARRILDRMPELTPEEKALMETAALLHDIGKIGIPDVVLMKENRLTRSEMEIVRQHVVIGEKILLHMDSMKDVAHWVRHHHERWDGLGYPDGMRAEAIPVASRVIGVADALDAMMTDRPYRRALSRRKAIQCLKDGKGTQFDPVVVAHAIECLELEEQRIHAKTLA